MKLDKHILIASGLLAQAILFSTHSLAGGGGADPCQLGDIERLSCYGPGQKYSRDAVIFTKEGYFLLQDQGATPQEVAECKAMGEFYRVQVDLHRDQKISYGSGHGDLLVSGYTGEFQFDSNGMPQLVDSKLITANNNFKFIMKTLDYSSVAGVQTVQVKAQFGLIKNYPGAYDAKDYDLIEDVRTLTCETSSN